ncbi:alpha/beta hydrolase [Mycolicibacterium aubagnense]|uniref:Esterase n=1 Tax=Mycolicibacterium aubagnense TaxID=319707 RepID=A0ABM7I998_9MYCO|nr:alpha/beta hydrolase [Mycolicibacterium aubagnense]WGI34920.1 alpha/beta hydrolase [Mycolicibacterium aubagnense]BBX83173.1 esterase [Mycolicibacterium aubagnense]
MSRDVVLDPMIARLVAAMATPPTLGQLGPQDGRLALREAQQTVIEQPGTVARFHTAPVGPSGLVGFWLVRPLNEHGPLPTVFYVHGGRFMFGDADTHGRVVGAIAARCRAAVVVPEYSRAPEARYPVALEECYAALLWVRDNAESLGVDAKAIALAGDCAGATIATAVTMVCKARGGPRLRAQLLYYPPTDARCEYPSHSAYGEGYLLTSDEQAWYWDQYCDGDVDCPTVSPLRAPVADLGGLPPTLIITAEADVVRDEGEAFGERLREAGVSVTCTRYLGTVHDFVVLSQLSGTPSARAALDQGVRFLDEAIHR